MHPFILNIQRIAAIQKNRNSKEVFLRLSVEGGGCSGFQYVFSIENGTPEEDDRYEDEVPVRSYPTVHCVRRYNIGADIAFLSRSCQLLV